MASSATKFVFQPVAKALHPGWYLHGAIPCRPHRLWMEAKAKNDLRLATGLWAEWVPFPLQISKVFRYGNAGQSKERFASGDRSLAEWVPFPLQISNKLIQSCFASFGSLDLTVRNLFFEQTNHIFTSCECHSPYQARNLKDPYRAMHTCT